MSRIDRQKNPAKKRDFLLLILPVKSRKPFSVLGIISLTAGMLSSPPSVRFPSGGLPYTLGFFLVEFTFAPGRRRPVSFLWHFTATGDCVSHGCRRRGAYAPRPALRQARTLQPSQAVEVWTFLNRPAPCLNMAQIRRDSPLLTGHKQVFNRIKF